MKFILLTIAVFLLSCAQPPKQGDHQKEADEAFQELDQNAD